MNVVLSSKMEQGEMERREGPYVRRSMEDALRMLSSEPFASEVERVFVIGGGKLYEEVLSWRKCEAVHFTEVDVDAECDTYFPRLSEAEWRLYATSQPKRDRQSGVRYVHLSYTRVDDDGEKLRGVPRMPPGAVQRHAEEEYLEVIRQVLDEGEEKPDRTGTGTLSVFGMRMRFDLRRSFPLLTTKRTFWRGAAEELLWFISGSTDANELSRKGIRIWDSNGSREFLDSVGLSHR